MNGQNEQPKNCAKQENAESAGFWQRVGAKIIDLVIVVLGMSAVALLSRQVSQILSQAGTDWGIISAFGKGMMILAGTIPLAYNSIMLGGGSATLGMKIFQIKVVRENGQPIGYGVAFLRSLVEVACAFASFGFGVILFFILLWTFSKGDDEQRMPTAMAVCVPAILLAMSPYLPVLFTKKKQATHDFVIVRTLVVRAR